MHPARVNKVAPEKGPYAIGARDVRLFVLEVTPAAEEKRRPSGGARHLGAESACHTGQRAQRGDVLLKSCERFTISFAAAARKVVQLVEESPCRIGGTVGRRSFQEGHAVVVGAAACRLIGVAGIEVVEITRGEAALDGERTGTEKRSLRRHGELSGEGGVARSAKAARDLRAGWCERPAASTLPSVRA